MAAPRVTLTAEEQALIKAELAEIRTRLDALEALIDPELRKQARLERITRDLSTLLEDDPDATTRWLVSQVPGKTEEVLAALHDLRDRPRAVSDPETGLQETEPTP